MRMCSCVCFKAEVVGLLRFAPSALSTWLSLRAMLGLTLSFEPQDVVLLVWILVVARFSFVFVLF